MDNCNYERKLIILGTFNTHIEICLYVMIYVELYCTGLFTIRNPPLNANKFKVRHWYFSSPPLLSFEGSYFDLSLSYVIAFQKAKESVHYYLGSSF